MARLRCGGVSAGWGVAGGRVWKGNDNQGGRGRVFVFDVGLRQCWVGGELGGDCGDGRSTGDGLDGDSGDSEDDYWGDSEGECAAGAVPGELALALGSLGREPGVPGG